MVFCQPHSGSGGRGEAVSVGGAYLIQLSGWLPQAAWRQILLGKQWNSQTLGESQCFLHREEQDTGGRMFRQPFRGD